MGEDSKDIVDKKPTSKKDTYLIIGAFALMVVAVITIWQVLLKGKMDEEKSILKDTVVRIKNDTVRIKDTIKNYKSQVQQNELKTNKPDSTEQPKIKDLTTDDKSKLKEKFEELPKVKRDRIKKNLKSKISN